MSSRSAIPSYPLAPLMASTLLFLAALSLGLGRGRPPVDRQAMAALTA